MVEIPAGMILCLMAIVIAILVAAILPVWHYAHPSKLELRIEADRAAARRAEREKRIPAGTGASRR
ncbi:hypothetical protein [Actinocorallia longicatena]|uniref:Uncharacterized protein n=1 Tax=Actinocorallia longicatena TaxID=111803 RepID=A0ABP6Q9Z0_9ACTN